ncbi:proton pump-interactor 1 [Iris pallida]|uniref:Proton pump-interactor 1 n=1 Tax=Iris pallida TaxID=29817 RepID=A0AAX6G5M3_IRIPA|nr:proton pump-interactor 1 [Iris pallida]
MGMEIPGVDTTTKQVDIKEGDASFLPEMDGKTLSDPGMKYEEPTKTGKVESVNGTDGEVKEAGHATNANLPKDVVDEWPEPKQIHTFYLVRFRSYEDPQLKAKIEQADKEVHHKNQARFQITEALKAKRAERSILKSQLQPFLTEIKKYKTVMDEKRKEREPLQAALGQLRTANTAAREKGMGLCSSEQDLNDLIQSLHYRIQHESNTLNEEKQLLKDIKQLEATREKVIANAATKAKIQDSKGQKDAIQDQVKLISADMDGVRKEREAIWGQINQVDEKLKVVDDAISSLEEELRSISERRDKAFETLNALRRVRDEANACFYQNRSLLNLAKDLAAKKDTKALEELSQSEVDKFIKEYSSDKAIRVDYERRILSSLNSRQLSRDGRMRNPDEKPIVVELPPAMKLEAAPLKVTPKQVMEVVKPPVPVDTVSTKKVQVDELTKSIEADNGGQVKESEDVGKTREDQPSSKSKEIDPAKLKEMKREEEIAKAKLAMERKKKMAEKSAAKAVARAQKEAEKKLKASINSTKRKRELRRRQEQQ